MIFILLGMLLMPPSVREINHHKKGDLLTVEFRTIKVEIAPDQRFNGGTRKFSLGLVPYADVIGSFVFISVPKGQITYSTIEIAKELLESL